MEDHGSWPGLAVLAAAERWLAMTSDAGDGALTFSVLARARKVRRIATACFVEASEDAGRKAAALVVRKAHHEELRSAVMLLYEALPEEGKALVGDLPSLELSLKVDAAVKSFVKSNASPSVEEAVRETILASLDDREAMLEMNGPRVLGAGHFGEVFLTTMKSKSDNSKKLRIVAVQLLDVYSERFPVDELVFLKDSLSLWKALKHENLLELFSTEVDKKAAKLVTVRERRNLSLFELIHQCKTSIPVISPDQAKEIMLGIASGLEYLHSRDIIHWDVRPKRIFLSSDLKQVKLDVCGVHRSKSLLTSGKPFLLSRLPYLAPELICENENTSDLSIHFEGTANDMYSVGIVFWEILHREHPWVDTYSSLPDAVVARKARPGFSQTDPTELCDMIERLWEPSPWLRMTATEMVAELDNSMKKDRRISRLMQSIVTKLRGGGGPLSLRPSALHEARLGEPFLSKRDELLNYLLSLRNKKEPAKNLQKLADMIGTRNIPLNKEPHILHRLRSVAFSAGAQNDVIHILSTTEDVELAAAAAKAFRFIPRLFNDDPALESLGTLHADQALQRAMIRFLEEESVAQWTCGIIVSMFFKEGFTQRLLESRLPELLLLVMRTHQENAYLQQQGCGAIRNIAYTDEGAMQLIRMNGAEVVLAALEAHPDDVHVQRQGCAALWNFAVDENHADKLMELGAPDAILKAMKDHLNDAEVQREACGAIGNLACKPSRKDVMMEKGMADYILEAMKTHPDDAGFLAEACNALGVVSFDDDSCLELVRIGAASEVVKSLQNHLMHQHLQKQGIGVIVNFTVHRENMIVLFEAGADRVLVNSIRQHQENAMLNELVSIAFYNFIVTGHSDRVVKIGATRDLIRMLSNFPKQVRIVKEACEGLTLLARNPNHTRMILKQGAREAIERSRAQQARNSPVHPQITAALHIFDAAQSRSKRFAGPRDTTQLTEPHAIELRRSRIPASDRPPFPPTLL